MFEFGFGGRLSVDYIVTSDNRLYEAVPGGGMAYSACGARLWNDSVGLVGRIASGFPRSHLRMLGEHGIDTERLTESHGSGQAEAFFAYEQVAVRRDEKPAPHFLRADRPLPKPLIPLQQSEGSRLPAPPDPVPEDLPAAMERMKGFHLAGVSWSNASLITSRLRELQVPLISLDPPSELMWSRDRERLQLLLHEVDVFLPSVRQAYTFFRPEKPTIWEMAASLAEMGPRVVVLKRGARGQALLDCRGNARWSIPAYPTQARDVTGAGHAYCGGYLVGLAETEDPLQAAFYGGVAASLCIEGTGPTFLLDALPELAQARLGWLADSARRA